MGKLKKRFVNTGPARPPCKGRYYTPLIAGVGMWGWKAALMVT